VEARRPPSEILVVLPEQDAGEPMGRIRPWKAVFVDHRDAGFRPLRR
jgi:hypothetical protein